MSQVKPSVLLDIFYAATFCKESLNLLGEVANFIAAKFEIHCQAGREFVNNPVSIKIQCITSRISARKPPFAQMETECKD